MKTIIDKIILSTFYILCLLAFFLMVEELPIILNKLFNTTVFENSVILSFGFCIFILGYVINYFDRKKANLREQQEILNTQKLLRLRNIKELSLPELNSISNIMLSDLFKIKITLSNNYNLHIDLQHFAHIDSKDKLYALDNFISKYISEKFDTTIDKIYFEYHLQEELINYIKTNLI